MLVEWAYIYDCKGIWFNCNDDYSILKNFINSSCATLCTLGMYTCIDYNGDYAYIGYVLALLGYNIVNSDG